MSKCKYAIDGRQLLGQMGGVQRYIGEILLELDKIISKDEVEVIIPTKGAFEYKFDNLKVVRFGHLKGLLWEQIDFPLYLICHNLSGVFLCTIISMLYPKGIGVIHDIIPAKYKDVADEFGSFCAKKLLLLNYTIAIKRIEKLVTVSRFSAEDIEEVYGRKASEIEIIGNGWQHIERVNASDEWLKRYPQIKRGEYYFCLSANRKQKNFKWIFEVAKRNPNSLFLIAGTVEEWQKNESIKLNNVIQLGFVSDEEVKSLMQNCKAFLFPSKYEGFGIPPMEALACGAKIIIAKASCLPEIYGNSAIYIDPDDYEVDLDKIIGNKVSPARECLSKYGWDISAKKLYSLMS